MMKEATVITIGNIHSGLTYRVFFEKDWEWQKPNGSDPLLVARENGAWVVASLAEEILIATPDRMQAIAWALGKVETA